MRNEKKEDWQKYLKEMQEIGPMLRESVEKKGSGIIAGNGKLEPINDKLQLVDKTGALIFSRADRRRMARENKKQAPSEKEYLRRMLSLDKEKKWLKQADRITKMKTSKIDIWFNEELSMLLGTKKVEKIRKYVERKGKWPWWKCYIKLKVQHEVRPYPWGTDHLAIYVFGRLHSAITYKWVDR